jgi:hypothetical protein
MGRPPPAHRIGFHDLEFSHYEPMPYRYPSGSISRRWVPVGMPRLNPVLEDSAVFLFRRDPQTGEVCGPEGTGMVVGRPWGSIPGRSHYYVVTNWHLLNCGATIIRINTDNGKSRKIDTEPHEWQFIPSSDDLAAYDITDDLHDASHGDDEKIVSIHENIFVTPDVIVSNNITIGEDVFMVGLFVGHPGNEQNIPLGRFGNLSRLASDQSPVEQPNGTLRPSHLIDMRSRGGFSGSPVFIYRTPFNDLSTVAGRMRSMPKPGDSFLMFLGVHCAQFPEEARVTVAESKGNIREGDVLKIPSRMTVVVPAWQVTRLLDLPYFEKIRDAREKISKQEAMSVPLPEIDQ